MKKWLLYGALFTGSFIIINVASYFFLIKNKTVKELGTIQSEQETVIDSTALTSDTPVQVADTSTTEQLPKKDIVQDSTLFASGESKKDVQDQTEMSDPYAGVNLTDQIKRVVEGYESRIADLQKTNAELNYELETLKKEKENRRAEMEEIWTELSSQFLSNINGEVQQLKTLVAKNEAAKSSATAQVQSGTKELAKIFNKMKEEAAAPIIASMDDKMAVEVIRNLEPKSAADILEAMSTERALTLSRLISAKKSQ